MPNRRQPLDDVFRALADSSRRGMVARLIDGPATVRELAAPLDMSLPAVMQHLQVLTDCGLVTTEKIGRTRTCQINPQTLRAAEDWLQRQRTEWERRLDRLGDVLKDQSEISAERSTP
jgi:DNA-binding transcriptional ArsR family regulator